MTSEREKIAYLAGILDGEGCFYIGKVDRKRKTHKSIAYTTRLYVGVTDKPLIDWIYKYFDGLVYVRKNRPQPHWRTQYTWVATAAQSILITRAVLAYLVIKREHAETFLRFCSTIGTTRKNGRIQALSPEVLKIRESCYQEIKRLNSRN